MTLTHIAIALSIGAILFLINFIVDKVDKEIVETQEERLARLVEGMKARREAMDHAHALSPQRRQSDLARS